MLAGVKEIVITPDFSALLSGFPTPDRFSVSVHDDLFAHCFYLSSQNEEVAIISLDLLCFPKWHVANMREKISKIAGIKEENCFISTTHTHSAPEARTADGGGIKPPDENGKFDPLSETMPMYPDYFNSLCEKVAYAVKDAKENSFTAKIGTTKGNCGPERNVGGNRHTEGGLADTGVYVTSIADTDDNIRGIIVRYSLHPTFLGGENLQITSDYPGYIYQCIKERYPNSAVAFQIGTAGDQSSRFFRSGCTFDEAKRVGYALGGEALDRIGEIKYDADPKITVTRKFIEPIRRDIPDYDKALKEYNDSLVLLEKSKTDGSSQGVVRSNECAVIGAKRMLGLAKVGKKNVYALNGHHPFELYLMMIGEIALVGIPTETFVKYGLDIQSRSPFEHTVVVTCANGYGRGYICTPESFSEGGYEALGSLYTGENGDNIVENVLNMLICAKENM